MRKDVIAITIVALALLSSASASAGVKNCNATLV